MSSSSPIKILTGHESFFLNTIKRIYSEYESRKISTEKIPIISEKLYEIWMKPKIVSNVINRNNEGYQVIEYLEQLISDNKMNDNFFILIISTLAKNQNFYHSLLNDHQRFQQLLNLSIRKPVYLVKFVFRKKILF